MPRAAKLAGLTIFCGFPRRAPGPPTGAGASATPAGADAGAWAGAWRLGLTFDGSTSFGQNRFEIFVALAVKEPLVGLERRHPALNFFAHPASGRRRRVRRRNNLVDDLIDDFDGPLDSIDFVERSELNPGFRPSFRPRLFPGDRLNKRHGLRDQKVALLGPTHCTPRPAPSSAKSRRSIKPRRRGIHMLSGYLVIRLSGYSASR